MAKSRLQDVYLYVYTCSCLSFVDLGNSRKSELCADTDGCAIRKASKSAGALLSYTYQVLADHTHIHTHTRTHAHTHTHIHWPLHIPRTR